MSVDAVRRLFTAEQFFQMIATDILTKHDHVELLEGEILEMTPIGRSHAACTRTFCRGEFISPAAFPDLAIAVDDIFD